MSGIGMWPTFAKPVACLLQSRLQELQKLRRVRKGHVWRSTVHVRNARLLMAMAQPGSARTLYRNHCRSSHLGSTDSDSIHLLNTVAP